MLVTMGSQEIATETQRDSGRNQKGNTIHETTRNNTNAFRVGSCGFVDRVFIANLVQKQETVDLFPVEGLTNEKSPGRLEARPLVSIRFPGRLSRPFRQGR